MTSMLELVGSLLAAVVLTLAGLFVELQSMISFTAGEVSTGAWFALLGALLLYAGIYLLGYERVVAELLSPAE